MSPRSQPRIETSMGTLTSDTITVRGRDLVDDLMGKVDAASLFFLEVTGRLPDEVENRLLNAMIVSIAEHGMMPSVIAARLTIFGAPESFQGAVASGLLGAGDVFVGPTSNVARILQVEAAGYEGSSAEKAKKIVDAYEKQGRRIPGLGHPHHPVDPRSEKLLAMQRELGAPRAHTDLMLAIHEAACKQRGKHLTFNAVAAVGAIASDIGIDWRAVRGIGLVARTIGLIGHVFEELNRPSAQAIWNLVEENSDYSDPQGA
ncbi:citryl-CoA lyase [Nitratireductor mangrovi]|uniref:citrate synthase (unknown stereospecificity) n=1 Tax=Nitratireductor mangrovi TaxID=2599600 RepID=A0A5B8KTM9_9HYPH|nr:citryl-CoA lyase [Nitratireductor mangrovi]QDY98965.1 citryl-CoA lyase [Nitratireductor mangrovi]